MDANAIIGIASAVGNGVNQADANRIKKDGAASGLAIETVNANNAAMEAVTAQINGGG